MVKPTYNSLLQIVFLVLPVTVVFAFWPGVVGLHLVTP